MLLFPNPLLSLFPLSPATALPPVRPASEMHTAPSDGPEPLLVRYAISPGWRMQEQIRDFSCALAKNLVPGPPRSLPPPSRPVPPSSLLILPGARLWTGEVTGPPDRKSLSHIGLSDIAATASAPAL